MRSVSIVYKKGRQSSLQDLRTKVGLKRSMDQYYNKLVEKQKYKEQIDTEKRQMLERIRLKTAKSHHKHDARRILETLNIAPVAFQPLQTERREQIKNRSQMALIRKWQGSKLQRGRVSLKGLNLPINTVPVEQDQIKQKNNHLKLKNIYSSKNKQDIKQTIVVLTANFIINQHNFWEEEEVDEQAGKVWKTLQNHANIVWICQHQNTLKKIIKFSKTNALRLDSVYLLQHKKKKRILTVSYNLIENDFGIKFYKSNSPLTTRQQKKMVVISGIEVQNMKKLKYSSFYSSVPIIKNYRSVVHFIRVDVSDKMRFGAVMKVLSQQKLPHPFNMTEILIQFQKKQNQDGRQECICSIQDFPIRSKQNLLNRLQQIKINYVKHLSQTHSICLNDKVIYDDTQNSINFLIGDILRRNYKIFQNYATYTNEYSKYEEHRRVHESKLEAKTNMVVKKYRNNVYLWDF